MSGLKVCIHANGGYDVVAVNDEGEEGEIREYVGFAMTPWELDGITKKFIEQGAIVTDFRSPEKLALASRANEAAEAARVLAVMALTTPGIEPEAVQKAMNYAAECMCRATEESC